MGERGEERYRNLRENDKNKQTETRERDRVVEEMGAVNEGRVKYRKYSGQAQ